MKTSTNDVFSPSFKSKLDPYFTSKGKEEHKALYRRLDKEEMRSSLATTRPRRASKLWSQGIPGVRSPVTRN